MLRPTGLLGRTVRRLGTQRWARYVLGPKVLTRLDRVVHRATGGRRRAADLLFDSLMLTTTGRRTGQPRQVALARLDLDGVPVVIASNFGREQHPAWSENLLAEPRATVERDGRPEPVRARLLDEGESARVWPQAVAIWPGYGTYREATRGTREIRMFALEPDPDRKPR
jgi:deazaflavin-dependent oxidoreductase (nitroreductase family)